MKSATGKRIVTALVVAATAGAGYAYFRARPEVLVRIGEANRTWLAIAAFAALVYFWSQAKLLKASLAACALPMRDREAFAVTFSSLLGNFLFPVAGLGFRAAVLNRQFGMRYGDFFATALALTFVELGVFAAGGLGALYTAPAAPGLERQALTLVLSAILTGSVVALAVAPRLPAGPNIFRKLNAFFDDWRRLRRDRAFLGRTLFWTLVMLLANAAIFAAVYEAMQLEAPIGLSFFAASLSDFSLLFRLAPGALGTYEASLLYAQKQFGVPMEASVSAVVVVRAVLTACLLVLGSASFAWLSRRPSPAAPLKTSPQSL